LSCLAGWQAALVVVADVLEARRVLRTAVVAARVVLAAASRTVLVFDAPLVLRALFWFVRQPARTHPLVISVDILAWSDLAPHADGLPRCAVYLDYIVLTSGHRIAGVKRAGTIVITDVDILEAPGFLIAIQEQTLLEDTA